MTSYPFDFHGHAFEARPSGALFWPARRWLIVADLHLGKSERLARRGGALLPPYETTATLDRLEAEIAATDPLTVISLGDAFDDDLAGCLLPAQIIARVTELAARRDWLWIGGNHDRAPVAAHLPGRSLAALDAGLWLRHEAGQGPDISGHFHPCIRLAGERRRCFLIGSNHVILPAFGVYTGGLAQSDPALSALVPQGLAIACGRRSLPVPLRHPRRA